MGQKRRKGPTQRFSEILHFCLKKGLIGKDEKLRIRKTRTLKEKKQALLGLMKTRNEENGNLLSTIVIFRSFERSLLTVKEKLEFESTLFSGSMEKNEDMDFAVANIERNAMLLSPVIRCVLKYLNLGDIKTCRFVCKEWNSVAQPFLTARSKITFVKRDCTHLPENPDFNTKNFFKQFSSTLKTNPFTAFKFCNSSWRAKWTVKELSAFFARQQETIRELEIPNFEFETGNEFGRFDISPWILNSPMVKANTKYLTKLNVGHNITVEISLLADIKDLSLSNCRVNLRDKIKMRPIKLKFHDVDFSKNGNTLSEYSITDMVDLSRLKSMDLSCCSILDLSGKQNLDSLKLYNITVRGWTTCGWTINILKLSNWNITEKTEMKIQELHLSSCQVDISVLPLSLKKLCISELRTRVYCATNQPVILPKLAVLDLSWSTKTETLMTINEFLRCPNLVSFSWTKNPLYAPSNPNFVINSWIPEHLEELNLSRFKINLSIFPLQINTLTMSNESLITTSPGQKVMLQKLRHLKLELECDVQDISRTFQLIDCPNLETLHMDGGRSNSAIINPDWIPESVERLKIRRVAVNWMEAKKRITVDKLVVVLNDYCDMKNSFGASLQTKELVLRLDEGYSVESDTEETLLNFLEYLYLVNSCVDQKRIIAGPFRWKKISFQKSPLMHLVDRKAEYYEFENQKGRALNINVNDFREIEDIQHKLQQSCPNCSAPQCGCSA